ncbi:DUF4391 domain-containing protein [Parageobacillus thermoglucosidasius]|uniref:DUF4391 domain-containing protein n=1 Tax=Parageobacillus thermoglucosidasius TaxID=1426 RepID=UPI000E1A4FD5|nr:DUF4391 domain-containing protein [Parageobacillus thermoglucosidasius]RDE34602.1 DUF4391 domain-containing protein [Parageobacillus thermoglucosidasius]
MAGFTFYARIGLDDKVRPLHKKLDKKMFYDFADLTKKEKDYITKYIDRIELTYLLTSSVINIQPFINEDYHYEGVMFITIRLRQETKDAHLPVIGEIVQGALPNPVVIVFEKEGNVQVGTCLKRLNKIDKTQVVLEEFAYTPWFLSDSNDETVRQFMDAVHITALSFSHFFRFYQDIHIAVQAFQHAQAVGAFYIAADEESRQLIAQIEQAEAEIVKWKNKMKKETQFNRKVEYHMKIQQLTRQIEQWKQQLR